MTRRDAKERGAGLTKGVGRFARLGAARASAGAWNGSVAEGCCRTWGA